MSDNLVTEGCGQIDRDDRRWIHDELPSLACDQKYMLSCIIEFKSREMKLKLLPILETSLCSSIPKWLRSSAHALRLIWFNDSAHPLQTVLLPPYALSQFYSALRVAEGLFHPGTFLLGSASFCTVMPKATHIALWCLKLLILHCGCLKLLILHCGA